MDRTALEWIRERWSGSESVWTGSESVGMDRRALEWIGERCSGSESVGVDQRASESVGVV